MGGTDGIGIGATRQPVWATSCPPSPNLVTSADTLKWRSVQRTLPSPMENSDWGNPALRVQTVDWNTVQG